MSALWRGTVRATTRRPTGRTATIQRSPRRHCVQLPSSQGSSLFGGSAYGSRIPLVHLRRTPGRGSCSGRRILFRTVTTILAAADNRTVGVLSKLLGSEGCVAGAGSCDAQTPVE